MQLDAATTAQKSTAEGHKAALARLTGERDTLQAKLEQSADDLEVKYQLAVQLVVAEAYEPALELAMDILRSDREFRDDIGRLTMIRIFDLLGKGHDLAGKYRRKMFNFMH